MNDQITITLDLLQHVCPKTPASILVQRLPPLRLCLELADATTPKRTAAAVAQFAYESGWFRVWIEEPSLISGPNFEHYEPGTPAGIRLGNTVKGDGFLFRGRSFVQETGRDNFTRCGKRIGYDLEHHPELAEDPVIGAKVSADYWRTHHCNEPADAQDFVEVTRRINGGLNGLPWRQTAYDHACQFLGLT